MRVTNTHWNVLFLLTFIFVNTISAQDTLLLHYANATISEIILDDSTNGSITGKGDDISKGKYMFFNSDLHKSPVAELVSVLMDLEVSNFTELDSFSVFVQQFFNGNWEDRWEKKFSFSEIEQESIPISNNGIVAYNFEIDLAENGIFDIGTLDFNIGIKYSYDSSAKIALRATGEGEFSEADSRCFTINEDGTISDFVSQYDAHVGLAIFPVTVITGNIDDISELGLEFQNIGNNILNVKSNNTIEYFDLSLISLDGRLIDKLRLNARGIVEFNTSALPPGIYILNVSNENRYGSIQLFLH